MQMQLVLLLPPPWGTHLDWSTVNRWGAESATMILGSLKWGCWPRQPIFSCFTFSLLIILFLSHQQHNLHFQFHAQMVTTALSQNSRLICATLLPQSLHQMLNDMHRAKIQGADVVEIRLDSITDSDLRILLRNKPIPVVLVSRYASCFMGCLWKMFDGGVLSIKLL